jgi:hypothetical protein
MVLREAIGFLEGGIPVKHGTGAGGTAPFPEDGKLWGGSVRPIDPSWLSGRQLFEPGIVGTVVDGFGRVGEWADGFGLKVHFRVGKVSSDEIGPAEEASLPCLVEFVVTS